MISFYILPKKFPLKGKGLSDARVALITKNEYGFTVMVLHFFLNIHKVYKVNN